jgi:hypothetical protein
MWRSTPNIPTVVGRHVFYGRKPPMPLRASIVVGAYDNATPRRLLCTASLATSIIGSGYVGRAVVKAREVEVPVDSVFGLFSCDGSIEASQVRRLEVVKAAKFPSLWLTDEVFQKLLNDARPENRYTFEVQ